MYRSKLQYLKKRVLIAKCEIHDGAYKINRIYFSVTSFGYQVFSPRIRSHVRYLLVYIIFSPQRNW